MPGKKHSAMVFVHGLDKHPALDTLEEIRRWSLERDDPNYHVLPDPDPGIAIRAIRRRLGIG
jgi:hypothetical protein